MDGNHCGGPHDTHGRDLHDVPGGINLHGRTVTWRGLSLAGLEGSPWYNGGPHQYHEAQMAWLVRRLIVSLLLNRSAPGAISTSC